MSGTLVVSFTARNSFMLADINKAHKKKGISQSVVSLKNHGLEREIGWDLFLLQ